MDVVIDRPPGSDCHSQADENRCLFSSHRARLRSDGLRWPRDRTVAEGLIDLAARPKADVVKQLIFALLRRPLVSWRSFRRARTAASRIVVMRWLRLFGQVFRFLRGRIVQLVVVAAVGM